jgi:hypothetical protein
MGKERDFNHCQEKKQEVRSKKEALELIGAGKQFLVGQNLIEFSGLDGEVAMALIRVGERKSVLESLDKFSNLNHQEVAMKVIEDGRGDLVAAHLDKFENLDRRVALTLIKEKFSHRVAPYLSKFNDLDDREVAWAMIEATQGWVVAENLAKFSNLNHQEVAMGLIDRGEVKAVAEYLDNFAGLDQQLIVLALVQRQEAVALAENLHKFNHLDPEIAWILIESGQGEAVMSCRDSFRDLSEAKLGQFFRQHLENLDLTKMSVGDFRVLDIYGQYPYYHFEQLELNRLKVALSVKLVLSRKWREVVRADGRLDCGRALEILFVEHGEWKNETMTAGVVREAGEIFGEKEVFDYLSARDDVRVGDKIETLTKMSDFYRNTGLSREEFYHKIMIQVVDDNSRDHHGLSSYQRFRDILSGLDITPSGLREIEDKIKGLEQRGFGKEMMGIKHALISRNYLQSWKNLESFSERVTAIIFYAEIWERLELLKKRINNNSREERLYNYVATLMWHQDSKVKIGAAQEFFLTPEKFLAVDDVNAVDEIHGRKKPSNYTEVDHLDLTARELVEALVTGELDQIQALGALEIIYSFNKGGKRGGDEERQLSFLTKVKREIGSRKEKTGNSKLFSSIKRYLREQKMVFEMEDVFNDEEMMKTLEGSLSREQKEMIEFLLQQYPNKILKTREVNLTPKILYRARVNLKSDPKAVVAGDDTVCCMPFGSGKNNVYTFNPNCALFTIEKQKHDGNWRTVAQSVLTLDMDIGINVVEASKTFVRENRLEARGLMTAKTRRMNAPKIVTADNIELAPNARNKIDFNNVTDIYCDFFARYLKIFGQANYTGAKLDEERVIVGQRLSDCTDYPKLPNTYLPLAPVSYSDNLGEEAMRLVPKELPPESNLKVEEIKPLTEIKTGESLGVGITSLTYQDTLAVAQLELKVYDNNQDLIEGLSALENALIAKDINNVNKKRPNLCLKYVDEQGEMQGYLLAYEGKIDTGESVIYVKDLAADKENSKLAGGKLIFAFVKLYQREYLAKGKLMPLLTQARKSTSYPIVIKHFQDWGKSLGISFLVEKLGCVCSSGETLQEIMLRPREL